MRSRPSWVVHGRRARGDRSAVRTAVGADTEAFRTDAARFPGGHTPRVCFPEDEAAVAALLAGTDPVLVVGAQSSLTGGATPFGETVLSTARLQTLALAGTDRVRVGAGVPHAVLGRELAARDRCYPAVPTYDGATVGGTVATNAAGAGAFKYGTTRRWVHALTVVLTDGTVLDLERGAVTASPAGHFEIVAPAGGRRRIEIPRYRMPLLAKLAAGYFTAAGMDLIDLFVGAEGTLGVVTGIDLDVLAHPPACFVGLTLLADEAAALALAGELRHAGEETRRRGDRRGIDVAAIEYLDARSLALVREDRADARLGIALPPGDAALLVQVDLDPSTSADVAAAEIARADDPTCDTPLTRLCRLLAGHGVLATTLPALPTEIARRDALFALRESVPEGVNRRIAAAQRAIDPSLSKSGGDPVVAFERLPELLAESRRILAGLELDYAVWGHLSDGNLHPNVLPARPADVTRAEAAQLAIGQAAIDLGGSPLSEHGVGRNRVKQELLRRLYGDAGVAAMRAVKRALDPRGILAPGVIFAP